DGNRLFAVSDNAAMVWDSATGKLLYQMHTDQRATLKREDQAKADEDRLKRAALASQSQQLKEYCELARGKERGWGLRLKTGVTADGEYLLTNIGDTREVMVWNLASDKYVRTFSLDKGDYVISFSGGKHGLMMLHTSLAGVGAPTCYELWDVKN